MNVGLLFFQSLLKTVYWLGSSPAPTFSLGVYQLASSGLAPHAESCCSMNENNRSAEGLGGHRNGGIR